MSLISKILLILILLPILGFIAGLGFYSWGSSDARIQWEICSSSPSSSISLFSNSNGVGVITKNGNAYLLNSCQTDDWLPIDDDLDSETEDTFYELCGEVHPSHINKVVSSVETCSLWGLGYSYNKYVLLEDGTIWIWSKSYGGEPWGLLVSPIFGTIAFFILAIFINVILIILHFASRFDEKIKSNDEDETVEL